MPFPEMICPNVSPDLVHPGSEVATLTKRASILQHPEEDLLRQVFTSRGIRRHSVEEREQTVVVACVQLTEVIHLATSYREHESVVAQLHRIANVKTGDGGKRYMKCAGRKDENSPPGGGGEFRILRAAAQ